MEAITTPHDLSATALIPITLLLTVGYIGVCVISPFRPCRRCHGTGHQLTHSRHRTRPCRRCGATGARLRFGRHIWNLVQRLRHDA